jgi:osmotically-inducible protein OsmY
MANNGQNNRDRIYDDHDEGNRRGDYPQRSIERGGQGQSGYTAGRSERDRSLDTQSYNQGYASDGQRDRHDIGADDRFSGRGGSDYTGSRTYEPQRYGAQGGYGYSGEERMGFNRGGDERVGYGRNDDRGFRTDPRHRNEHNARRDRGMGPRGDVRGYGHQFSGNEGYDARFDNYGGNRGYDHGYGGTGGYGSRGFDRGFDEPSRYHNDEGLGGYGGQSIHGDYGASESERGVWSTDMQRGRQQLGNNAGWGTGVSHTGQFREQYGTERSEGRRSPSHRGKGPQGWQRSDEKIKDLICEALTDDHHIDASGIDVEVKAGEVTLTGMVPDRQTKRLAEDLVERMSGVKDVQNSLKVSADERMRYGQHQGQGAQSSTTPNGSTGHTGQNGKDPGKKAQA